MQHILVLVDTDRLLYWCPPASVLNRRGSSKCYSWLIISVSVANLNCWQTLLPFHWAHQAQMSFWLNESLIFIWYCRWDTWMFTQILRPTWPLHKHSHRPRRVLRRGQRYINPSEWMWGKKKCRRDMNSLACVCICVCGCVFGLLHNTQDWDYRERGRKDCQELGSAHVFAFHLLILPTCNVTPHFPHLNPPVAWTWWNESLSTLCSQAETASRQKGVTVRFWTPNLQLSGEGRA